ERLPEVARTVGGWVHEAKQYLDGMKSELDRDLQLSELQRETRESFDKARSSLDDPDRAAREDAEASGEEHREGEAAGESEQPAEEAVGQDPEPSDGGDPGSRDNEAGQEPEPRESGADPVSEEQAATDMEQELKQDQPQDDKERG
ncbi:MAG TPA: hypothetical protein VKA48_12265, partial [Gammaproteobacteria bacterium]|nr:hypothetical protein [Gammaproteobacteria bacterium]